MLSCNLPILLAVLHCLLLLTSPPPSLQRLKVLKPLSEPGTFCTTLWRPVKGVLFYGPPGTGGGGGGGEGRGGGCAGRCMLF